MNWSRSGDLDSLIIKNKKSNGEIPPETCPLINEVLSIIDNNIENKEIREKVNNIMEEIRTHNGKLRMLGIDWYEFCNELASKSDDIIINIEKERDNYEEDMNKFKEERDSYYEELRKLNY